MVSPLNQPICDGGLRNRTENTQFCHYNKICKSVRPYGALDLQNGERVSLSVIHKISSFILENTELWELFSCNFAFQTFSSPNHCPCSHPAAYAAYAASRMCSSGLWISLAWLKMSWKLNYVSVQKRSHQPSMCSTTTKTFTLTKSLGLMRLSSNVTRVLAIIFLSMEQEKQFLSSEIAQLSLDSLQFCLTILHQMENQTQDTEDWLNLCRGQEQSCCHRTHGFIQSPFFFQNPDFLSGYCNSNIF